jgi:hypothetical protein
MAKLLLVVAAVATAALVVGTTTLGSAELASPGTIKVTTRGVERQFIDRGARGRDAGDQVVSRQLVFNRGITPRAIGHSDLVCTYTSSYSRQCGGTYTLPKGKIVVMGAVNFRQFQELAVIGGTGVYDNVRGSVTVTLIGQNPLRELLVFRLVV